MKHIITLSALTIWSFVSCPDACAQFNTITSNSQRPKILTKETDKNEGCPSEQCETVPKDTLSEFAEDSTALYDRYLSVSYPLDEIKVNSKFGMRKHPVTKKYCMHNGIDLKAHYEQVYSMLPGEVVGVGQDSRSGKYVTVRTANYTISYCHLSQAYAACGDIVKAGEIIAKSGNTGRSTGPHLHLTSKKDGKAFDPTILINFIRSVKNSCLTKLAF